MHWSPAAQQATWLEPTGPAIGLTRQPSYSSRRVFFSRGDIFVFYTDGLVEAKNREEDEFGEDRLLQVVRTHADKSAKELHDTLFKQARDFAVKFQDDATLLVLKIAQT